MGKLKAFLLANKELGMFSSTHRKSSSCSQKDQKIFLSEGYLVG